MQAIILDMYGVIVKDTGDGFYDFVNKTFPDLSVKEMYITCKILSFESMYIYLLSKLDVKL